MNMPKVEEIMAGHLNPLIIRLVTETVWMDGDCTSLMPFRALKQQFDGPPVPAGRINVEKEGSMDSNVGK